MQFTGHRTDVMFRRYRIVDAASQVLAAEVAEATQPKAKKKREEASDPAR